MLISKKATVFLPFVNLKYATKKVFTWNKIALDLYRCPGYFTEMPGKRKEVKAKGAD